MPEHESQPDYGLVKIDTQLTEAFRHSKKNKEAGSNPIYIGKNERGVRVLLKTSIHFWDDANKKLLNRDTLEAYERAEFGYWNDEFLSDVEGDIRGQVAAQSVARWLGISSPSAEVVDIDNTPFIAMEYLEGAEDRGRGAGIELAELKNQEEVGAMALGKLFTNALGDGGQILIQNGHLFLTEINIGTLHLQNPPSQERLLQLLQEDCLVPRENSSVREFQIGFITTSDAALPIVSRVKELLQDQGLLAQVSGYEQGSEQLTALSRHLEECIRLFVRLRQDPSLL